MKKSNKVILIASLSTLAVGGVIGTTVSLLNNKKLNSNSDTNTILNSNESKFSFRTYSNSTTESENNLNYVKPEIITKKFQSGYVKTPILMADDSVSYEDRYQSDCYYNQREFMPILSSASLYNYPNERYAGDALNGVYYGWNKTEVFFNIEGLISNKNNWAVSYLNYTPSNALKQWSNSEKIEIKELIKGLSIDCSKFSSVSKINEYLQTAQKMGIEFITIKTPSQDKLEQIIIPEGIKKLTIVDYNNKNQSSLTSFRGITIPSSVIELEFYSNTCKKFDPLILSSSTHMIYDHIESKPSGIIPVNFSTIDLSSHSKLTEQQLQRAIDIVYIERQFERNFQGDFVGGYIYQLDITNTPIKTLNNVKIPSQSDGRFNIAYVKWNSNTQSGQITINIDNNSKPSNDSLVGEWYDESAQASLVNKLVVETKEAVSIDLAKSEILGQIKKYPNINEVDLKNVKLLDNKSLNDLIKEINNALTNPLTGEISKNITFITNEQNTSSETNNPVEINENFSSDISYKLDSNEIAIITNKKVDYKELAKAIVAIANKHPNIHKFDITDIELLDDRVKEEVIYEFSVIFGDEIAETYNFILNNGKGNSSNTK